MQYIIDTTGLVVGWMEDGCSCVLDPGTRIVESTSREYSDLNNSYMFNGSEFVSIENKPDSFHKFNGTTWIQLQVNNAFPDNRISMYPSIQDQLDMLWHAMDNGEIPKAIQWYNAIKIIKDNNPKE